VSDGPRRHDLVEGGFAMKKVQIRRCPV